VTALAYALLLARLVVGFSFGLAAATKLRDVAAFRHALEDLQVVPRRVVPAVGAAVLVGETSAATLMLASGWYVAAGFAVAIGLLAAFSAAVASALRRRLRVRCNCFGATTAAVSRVDLARKAAFGLVAVAGLVALGLGPGAPVAIGPAVLMVPIAAVLVALLVNLTDIVATLVRPFPVEMP
jgi:hypothetical protein